MARVRNRSRKSSRNVSRRVNRSRNRSKRVNRSRNRSKRVNRSRNRSKRVNRSRRMNRYIIKGGSEGLPRCGRGARTLDKSRFCIKCKRYKWEPGEPFQDPVFYGLGEWWTVDSKGNITDKSSHPSYYNEGWVDPIPPAQGFGAPLQPYIRKERLSGFPSVKACHLICPVCTKTLLDNPKSDITSGFPYSCTREGELDGWKYISRGSETQKQINLEKEWWFSLNSQDKRVPPEECFFDDSYDIKGDFMPDGCAGWYLC